MNTRLYTPEDYPTAKAWWDAHKLDHVPAALLPSLGVVVEDDSRPVVMAWLYRDGDSKLGWIAWTIANPENRPLVSARAVQIMLGAMVALATEFRIPILYAQLLQKGLRQSFKRIGFIETHQVTQLIRPCPLSP